MDFETLTNAIAHAICQHEFNDEDGRQAYYSDVTVRHYRVALAVMKVVEPAINGASDSGRLKASCL